MVKDLLIGIVLIMVASGCAYKIKVQDCKSIQLDERETNLSVCTYKPLESWR